MNKKAAIGLSVELLVTIIISLVILGSGVALLYKFIGGAEEVKRDLDRKTSDQLERLLVDQGKKVALPLHVADVSRGEEHVFGIGILNTLGLEKEFYINVELNKVIDELDKELNIKPNEVSNWLLFTPTGIFIENGAHHKEPILVSVPKDALVGQYIFTATISYVDEQGKTILYGNPQKFYVNVK